MYTSGTWIVKSGEGEEFARRWQESVDQLSLQYPGITFRLLRDVENPLRFVSFGGPWRNAEQIAASRSEPSFQEGIAALQEVLESVELTTHELVAEIS